MSKTLEKTSEIAKNYLTIYSVIAVLFSGAAFAADQYHEQFLKVGDFKAIMAQEKDDREKAELKKEIKQLIRQLAQMKINRRHARTQREKNRIDDLKTEMEADLKILKEELKP